MPNWVKIEQVREDVVGLRPEYTDTGDATEIITASGEVLQDRRGIRSVQKALFRSYMLDPRAQRDFIREKLGRQLVLPFYLGPERVFVPVKMRRPRAQNDTVYGYIDLKYIRDIMKTEGRGCRLLLTNGLELDIFSTRETMTEIKECGARLAAVLQGEKDESRAFPDMVAEAARTLVTVLWNMNRHLQEIEKRLDRGD